MLKGKKRAQTRLRLHTFFDETGDSKGKSKQKSANKVQI